MIALALEALAASALLMLLVLVLRGPVRRAFGARIAYALWALPALRLLLPPMPAGWQRSVAAPMSDLGTQALVAIVPESAGRVVAAAPAAVSAASGMEWTAVAGILWVAGAAGVLVWQVLRYARFSRRVLDGARPLARVGSVEVVESAAADGPLAFGIVRRVVAFPRDFDARYDADERELALAHELGHHARGDLWANWIALAVLALHWFDPIAWFAFRAFRADQEMANDAGVLAQCGADARHAYGCAIVKAAHGRALTPACHLNTVEDLKSRLRMLGRDGVTGKRLIAGMVATTGVTLAGLAITASGTSAAASVRAKVETVTGVDLADLDRQAARLTAVAMPAPVHHVTHDSRVEVVKDGKRTIYVGDAADAYIAAHPSVPPVTPVPPMPPVPPVTPMHVAPVAPIAPREVADVMAPIPPTPPMPPRVTERVCVDGRDGSASQLVVSRASRSTSEIVICNNRIERISTDAAARGAQVRRQALQGALASLQATRAGMSARGDLPAETRADVLQSLDESIAEMRAEIADNDD